MFDQIFDHMRKVAEYNLGVQQQLFKNMTGLWQGAPEPGNVAGRVAEFQEKWLAFVAEMARRQRERLEPQYKTGLKVAEEAFHLVEVKDPEELRDRTIKLWQTAFGSLRQLCEAEMADFETAVVQWAGLVGKGVAPPEAAATAA